VRAYPEALVRRQQAYGDLADKILRITKGAPTSMRLTELRRM
jgi:hypothetical protein